MVEGGCHSGESHDCHGAANQVQLIQETKRVIWIGPTHKRAQRLNGPNAIDYKHSFDKNQGPIYKNYVWAKIVLHCTASYLMVLHGIGLYCLVLHSVAFYRMVLHCDMWYASAADK